MEGSLQVQTLRNAGLGSEHPRSSRAQREGYHAASRTHLATVSPLLEARRLGFKPNSSHLMTLLPWAGDLPSLRFSFLIFKMGIIIDSAYPGDDMGSVYKELRLGRGARPGLRSEGQAPQRPREVPASPSWAWPVMPAAMSTRVVSV